MDRFARAIALGIATVLVIVGWTGRSLPSNLVYPSALPDSVPDSTHLLLEFGGPAPDAQILALLHKHELRPVTLYLYTDGLWATHRVSLDKSTVNEIGSARNIVAEMMRGGLRSTQQRAAFFFAVGKVGTGQTASTRKKSFLTVIEREKAVIRSATGGRPLIYAVEVVGTPTTLAAAGADPIVRAAHPAWRVNGRVRTVRPARPTGSDRPYRSSVIDALAEQDADARIAEIVLTGVKEVP
jgi:hypothetical protein